MSSSRTARSRWFLSCEEGIKHFGPPLWHKSFLKEQGPQVLSMAKKRRRNSPEYVNKVSIYPNKSSVACRGQSYFNGLHTLLIEDATLLLIPAGAATIASHWTIMSQEHLLGPLSSSPPLEVVGGGWRLQEVGVGQDYSRF